MRDDLGQRPRHLLPRAKPLPRGNRHRGGDQLDQRNAAGVLDLNHSRGRVGAPAGGQFGLHLRVFNPDVPGAFAQTDGRKTLSVAANLGKGFFDNDFTEDPPVLENTSDPEPRSVQKPSACQ